MTVSQQFVIELAMQVAAGLLAIITVLVGLIWKGINAKLDRTERMAMERLRTLGHEDRAIRSQIHDLMILLDKHAHAKVSDVAEENARLKWMLNESDKIYKRGQDDSDVS